MPRTSVAKRQTTVEEMAVLFVFTDGENVRVNALDLPEIIQKNATLAGLSYVLGNSYSGEEVPADARKKLIDRLTLLQSGKWTGRTAGAARVSAVALDYSELMGVTQEKAAEIVKDLTREAKSTFRRDASTARAIATIKDYEPADSMARLLNRTEEERVAFHEHQSVQEQIAIAIAKKAAEKAKEARAAAKGASLDDI